MARFSVSESEWERRRGVVLRLAESGLSMAEFARREGVAYAALLAWRRRFEAPASTRGAGGSEGFGRGCGPADLQGRGGGDSAPATGGFAELLVRPSAPLGTVRELGGASPAAVSVEIALPSGTSIRLYNGADVALVRAAVEAARSC